MELMQTRLEIWLQKVNCSKWEHRVILVNEEGKSRNVKLSPNTIATLVALKPLNNPQTSPTLRIVLNNPKWDGSRETH